MRLQKKLTKKPENSTHLRTRCQGNIDKESHCAGEKCVGNSENALDVDCKVKIKDKKMQKGENKKERKKENTRHAKEGNTD